MSERSNSGHRERIRIRFLSGETSSHTEEALLELLLTYAIPQKDVQPLARQLLNRFGSLEAVLSANLKDLCEIAGIKEYSAILINLVDVIRRQHQVQTQTVQEYKQTQLFEHPVPGTLPKEKEVSQKDVVARKRSGIIGKAILKEAIEILPKLPETRSLSEIRQFIVNNLHFSAEKTRRRYANYIIQRMFTDGIADDALRLFARKYQGAQELRDLCFYRFCKAEPLMVDVISDLIIPAIGVGRVSRQRLQEYLVERFPESKSIKDCTNAIVEALNAGGITRSNRTHITFSYRDILKDSFAAVLYSEFPEPGMYDIAKLEQNRQIEAMLWNPTRVLPTLYELRNQEMISKISEIDTVRQFTTRLTLDELVSKIADIRKSDERC